jgi:peptidoglycan hydrolase-like protein with peptidoglycan-binding domain
MSVMRRRRLLVLVVAAVAVSSLASWIANEQIQSPAEAAARSAPPAPAPILVPVKKQVLATKVVTRGTAHYGSPRKLSVTPSGLKTGPRVITTLPRAGSTVSEGEVLLTISGRPVFVLRGAHPSYRDLGPGMSGPDVGQLERALKRSGFDPGQLDDVYDAQTAAAVEALYRRHRFPPVVATEAQLAAARPREAEMVEGTRAEGGVQLPADEVIFVHSTPLRVTELPVGIGASPSGPLVTVTDSSVVIDGFLPVEQAGRVREGAEVLIDEPALGIRARGKVSRVAERAGTDGADGFHVSFEVAVEDPPAALIGASVRLTVPIKSTRRAQLTVPLSAVSLAPDGGSRVQRSAGEQLDFVPVRTGLSADGYVSVVPREGALAAGDLVVVGFEGDVSSGG